MNTANIMNHELNGLSRQYQVALRKHLKQGPRASLKPAQGLVRQAITTGLETLDLVRIHEQALAKLVLPGDAPVSRAAMVRRAGAFFAEAITPIEETHRLAQETNAHMDRLKQRLRRRSADLAASKRELRQEIAQRKLAEEALRKSEQHYARSLEQSRQMHDQLRHLSRQLLSAQEQERKRISRELHEVIARTLTGINARLAIVEKEADLNLKGLEQKITRTQQLVQQSVAIVHRFARELRPAVLDDLGLIPALHSFVKVFGAETGIRVSLSAFAGVEQVTGDIRTMLYRVAQEALANIARHSRASQAEVKIEKVEGDICMKIHDNGHGFQVEHVLRGNQKSRLGILGMRERLEMVGGNFSITSAPGKGTAVLAQIPLIDRASGGRADRAR